MNTRDLQNLHGPDLIAELEGHSDLELLALFGSKSSLVGDCAVQVLSSRGCRTDLIKEGLRSGQLSRKVAKIRALNHLLRFGLSASDAVEVYVDLLRDKSEDVAGTALFGIVFFQDEGTIQNVSEWREMLDRDSELYCEATRALEALWKKDPLIFSPYFRDRLGVWNLHP